MILFEKYIDLLGAPCDKTDNERVHYHYWFLDEDYGLTVRKQIVNDYEKTNVYFWQRAPPEGQRQLLSAQEVFENCSDNIKDILIFNLDLFT